MKIVTEMQTPRIRFDVGEPMANRALKHRRRGWISLFRGSWLLIATSTIIMTAGGRFRLHSPTSRTIDDSNLDLTKSS
ncbi:hypothetical protein L484_017749 [Morus notabilis]|uniref:Uncharacterized protein n=1 Tax=Morus notabilis TaxID=981085 RepID=W9R3C6_9ROSA|nr:hypothetical protein L484_017749 [Morus notabilis]